MKSHLIKYIACLVGFFCLSCPVWSKIKPSEYNDFVSQNPPIYWKWHPGSLKYIQGKGSISIILLDGMSLDLSTTYTNTDGSSNITKQLIKAGKDVGDYSLFLDDTLKTLYSMGPRTQIQVNIGSSWVLFDSRDLNSSTSVTVTVPITFYPDDIYGDPTTIEYDVTLIPTKNNGAVKVDSINKKYENTPIQLFEIDVRISGSPAIDNDWDF